MLLRRVIVVTLLLRLLLRSSGLLLTELFLVLRIGRQRIRFVATAIVLLVVHLFVGILMRSHVEVE